MDGKNSEVVPNKGEHKIRSGYLTPAFTPPIRSGHAPPSRGSKGRQSHVGAPPGVPMAAGSGAARHFSGATGAGARPTELHIAGYVPWHSSVPCRPRNAMPRELGSGGDACKRGQWQHQRATFFHRMECSGQRRVSGGASQRVPLPMQKPCITQPWTVDLFTEIGRRGKASTAVLGFSPQNEPSDWMSYPPPDRCMPTGISLCTESLCRNLMITCAVMDGSHGQPVVAYSHKSTVAHATHFAPSGFPIPFSCARAPPSCSLLCSPVRRSNAQSSTAHGKDHLSTPAAREA